MQGDRVQEVRRVSMQRDGPACVPGHSKGGKDISNGSLLWVGQNPSRMRKASVRGLQPNVRRQYKEKMTFIPSRR